jgi:hypothetical protein
MSAITHDCAVKEANVKKRLVFSALLMAVAVSAFGQMQIKVNENVNLKFGLLLQTQGDATEDAVTQKYLQNVYIRRARLMLGGQITPALTFFAETDSPNIGKSTANNTKNQNVSMYLQDAYVEYKFADAFALEAGLMLVAPSRNGLQSAASLMPVDYSTYTFTNSASLQNSAGRDTGFQARGYFLDKKLEYRAGIFQGMRDTANRELRTTVRMQYNFFDAETTFFYTGTYLGKKKVLAVGAGYDHQHGYSGQAIDAFLEYPLKSGSITAQADSMRYDGGQFLKSLLDQRNDLFEAGYLIGKSHFMPVLQYTQRNVAGRDAGDEKRFGAGLNYFLMGHNANIKALYYRVDTKGLERSSQFTVQLQFFYF